MPNKEKTAKVDYKDIDEDDAEYLALSKLNGCGINLGYDNRKFAGNEKVTWFDTVKLLDKTLKFAGITSKTNNVDMNAPADKEDFERLKNILISKKAKIRSILSRKNS